MKKGGIIKKNSGRKKKKQKKQSQYNIQNKMVVMNPNTSIIVININGLNASV